MATDASAPQPPLDFECDIADLWQYKCQREWAIYVWSLGCELWLVARQLKCSEKEAQAVLKRIMKGEDPEVSFINRPLFEGLPWKERHDFIIRKMVEYGRTLADAAQLLHREPASVKARWHEIKTQHG